MNTGLLHLGIDPGADTGLAVYAPGPDRLLDVRTMSFWEAVEWVLAQGGPDDMVLVLEDPTATSHVWQAKQRESRGVQLRKAQSVGANKRDAQLWFDLLAGKGYHVLTKAPGSGRGWDGAKWTAKLFRAITGWTGSTSQHARDAAALVYGMNGRLDVYRKTQPMDRPTLKL